MLRPAVLILARSDCVSAPKMRSAFKGWRIGGRGYDTGAMKRPARTLPLRIVCLTLLALAAVSAAVAETLQPTLERKVHQPDGEAGDQCALRLRLVDEDGETELPGLVRIEAGGKRLHVGSLLQRGTMLRRGHPAKDWFCLPEAATVSVPQGRVRVEGFAGLETEIAAEELDLTGRSQAEMTLRLKRFAEPKSKGWRIGNTHLHLRAMSREQADKYLTTVSRADGLEVVFVSYLRRIKADKDYISNEYTKPDLHRLSGLGVLFENGEEHRHNFGPGGEGFGHVMFLDLQELVRPVSIGAGIMGEGFDAPPLRTGIDRARAQDATIVWCHNKFGFEDVPNWLTGRVHAQNIFDGGTQGSYRDSFYRLLNLGFRVPFSTGTDWFIYDFSRVYARVGEKPLSIETWLKALREGRTFITNGPLLEFQVGDRGIGDTIQLQSAAALPVKGNAVSRNDFGELQVIRDGKVVHSVPSRGEGGHFVAQVDIEVEVDGPGWLALRVASGALDTGGHVVASPVLPVRGSGPGRNEMGAALFAHTSPVYLEFRGDLLFDPASARELMAEIEEGLLTIQMKGSFRDERQREEVLAVYRQAMQWLE